MSLWWTTSSNLNRLCDLTKLQHFMDANRRGLYFICKRIVTHMAEWIIKDTTSLLIMFRLQGLQQNWHTVAGNFHPNYVGAFDGEHIYTHPLKSMFWKKNICGRTLISMAVVGCYISLKAPRAEHQMLVSFSPPTWFSFVLECTPNRYNDRYMVWNPRQLRRREERNVLNNFIALTFGECLVK